MATTELFVAVILSTLSLVLLGNGATAQDTSPQFTSQPGNVTIAAGATTTLECSATGSPTPTITWYKNGLLLSTPTSGSLGITNVQSSDVGRYYCVASNTAGSIQSKTATLRLAYLDIPAVDTDPVITRVVNLESLVLSCDVPESVPHPQITWTGLAPRQTNNGRVAYSPQSGSLVFSSWNIDNDNNLIVQCFVSNPLTGASHPSSHYWIQEDQTGSSQIYHATEFEIRPDSDLTVVEGEVATFECFTTGTPTATITWSKDGQQLSISGRISASQAGRVLNISGVLPSDAGSYSCDTTHPASQGTYSISAIGRLAVIVPPRITLGLDDQTDANLDQQVSLVCRAEGTLPLQWTWRKDGVPLRQEGGVAFTTSGSESTLIISSLVESDRGVYQCVAMQPSTGREALSNNLLNPMAIAPMLTHGDTLRDQLVLSGSTVKLPCTATGAPIPRFTWTRAGLSQPINIDAESRYSLSPIPGEGNLTITESVVTDSATLTCRAINSASTVSDSVQLRVIDAPGVVQSPSGQIVITPGNSHTLHCTVTPPSSDVTVEYRWTRDGAVYSSQQSISFITNTNDSPTSNGINGRYTCTVLLRARSISEAEPLEWQVGFAVVTVGAPPVPPTAPTNHVASAITATSFIASWTPPTSDGGLALQNYTIEVRRLGSEICPGSVSYEPALEGVDASTTTISVPSLHPYSRYTFRVVAFNSVFRSLQGVASSEFQTPQSRPQAPPTFLRLSPGSSDGQLRANWDPIASCVDYGGPITGYVLQYKTSSEEAFIQLDVDATPTSFTLTGLQLSMAYQVKVAAKTASGIGPFTAVAEGMTSESTAPPSLPPSDFDVSVINSTAVQLTWSAPGVADPNEIIGYCVWYTNEVGQIIPVNQSNAGPDDRNAVVTGLDSGRTYTFRVAAKNKHGAGPPANHTLSIPTEQKPFYEELWFYVVAAVGGVLIIGIVIATIILICCCCKCVKSDGKYYVTSRRTTSSMSSNGFSEYHNKNNRSQHEMIHIHDSPTPSRRSTDYADIGPGRFGPLGVSGYPNPDAVMNGHARQTGNFHGMYPHDQHMTHDGHMTNDGHMTHDGHMGRRGQFSPNEQGLTHGNSMQQRNDMHIFNEQGYPHGNVQPHQRQTHPQSYNPQNEMHNMGGQFYPAEQNFPPQNTSYPPQDDDSTMGTGRFSSRFVDTMTRVHTPPNPNSNDFTDNRSDYPPSSRNLSQSTEESWNPMENLNYRGHMTNNPVSRSSSFKSTESTTSFERVPHLLSDPRMRGNGNPLSPLPENQFFEQVLHDMPQPLNTSSMHDLQHVDLQPSKGRSSSVGQKMNRMVNQNMRNRTRSFEGMIDRELGQSNLDIQQRALPPIPTNGMERGHTNNVSPIPNPHSIEYTMDPEVQMSHSLSVSHLQPRAVAPQKQVRSHAYPSRQTSTGGNPTHRQHSSSMAATTQPSLPPPPPFFEGELPPAPSSGGHLHLPPPPLQQHSGVAHSMTQLQQSVSGGNRMSSNRSYQDQHQRQQSLPDNQEVASSQHRSAQQHLPNQFSRNHHHHQQQSLPPATMINQSTPNLAFNEATHTGDTPSGFRRIPMSSGRILSPPDEASQDTAAAWEQVDHIQQQFELDMQNMLTPRVTDEGQFEFQHDDLDISINSSSSFADHTHSMVSPIVGKSTPNGFTMTSSQHSLVNGHGRTNPPKIFPRVKSRQVTNGTQMTNGFDHNSSALNKKRPSVPDLQHLTDNDPKKPQLKKGKVPRAVWVQTSTHKRVESSSESDSDSDLSVDTVIAGPHGDTDSLKSSHV